MDNLRSKNNTQKVLIVEDDLTLAYFLRTRFERDGYDARVVDSGKIALQQLSNPTYKLVILDINLPELNGLDVLKNLRHKSINTPVIITTVNIINKTEILSYKLGANIFHRKPINFGLLMAQVQSIFENNFANEIVKIGDIEMDQKNESLLKAGKLIDLTYKEYKLMECIINARCETISRSEILGYTFKGISEPEMNSVDTLVSRARKKLGNYKNKPVIETVHGRGFRLNVAYLEDQAPLELDPF